LSVKIAVDLGAQI